MAANKYAKEDYDNVTDDPDMDMKTDVKLSFSFYFHTTEMKIQESLIKENLSEGLQQFQMLVTHLELLCRANKQIPKLYDELVLSYTKDNEEYRKEDNNTIRGVMLANKKLELIYGHVFGTMPLSQGVKVSEIKPRRKPDIPEASNVLDVADADEEL